MTEERRDAEGGSRGPELGPLAGGPHGYSREQVAHSQRERLIAGLAQAVAERGYNNTTISDVTKAASVSRRVFYENFSSKEECFIAAFDIVVEHLRDVMVKASRRYEEWPDQVIAGLRAMLRFFASDPELARLCLVESVAAGPNVAKRFRAAVQGFIPLLEAGRESEGDGRKPPASTEDSLVGALVLLLSREIMAGKTSDLEDLLPDLVEFVLLPYLGLEEAQRYARLAARP